MSYRRFQFSETELPPATVATLATVPTQSAEIGPTVASVATVAGQITKPAFRTVASVATVAGMHLKAGFRAEAQIPLAGPGVTIMDRMPREVPGTEYDDRINRLMATAATADEHNVLRHRKRKGSVIDEAGELIWTRGRA